MLAELDQNPGLDGRPCSLRVSVLVIDCGILEFAVVECQWKMLSLSEIH